MSETYVDIPYAPTGALNATDSESSLGDNEISDMKNLLQETKQIFSRPGLFNFHTPPLDSTIIYAKGFEGTDFSNMFITAKGDIWRRFADNTLQKGVVVGGPTSFGPVQYFNMDQMQAQLLIGNNVGGIIVWSDPFTGGQPTVIPTAKYRYVVGHYSRAFAAVDETGGSGGNAKVAWSVPGDPTTWTAPPNTINGSGSAVLSDIPDFITGLGIIRNVVVIYRNSGIHLGYVNSSNSPAYNFQAFSKEIIGLTHPSSLASANNLHFFVGQEDVRVFDLNSITNIGYKIRKKLVPFLNAGVPILGFCTTSSYFGNNCTDKLCYHLLPMTFFGSTMFPSATQPFSCTTIHFRYSVEDGNWSIHDYNFLPTAGLNFMGDPAAPPGLNNPFSQGPCLIEGNPPNFHLWDDAMHCERPMFMVGKVQGVGQPEKDYLLQRMLLRFRDYGSTLVTATVQSRLNYINNLASKVQAIGQNGDNYWTRVWFDLLGDGNQQGTGQDFQVRLDIVAGSKFALDYIGLRLTEAGDFRG